MTERIGIGVTTHNRVGMLHQCVYNIECHTPDDRVLVVVDDASDPAPYHPFKAPGQTYRFEQNVGVARVKNKCIELLMASEVDHVFLFDDDTWPVEKDWWRQYTESGYEHLSWNWLPCWDDYRDLWPLADDHGITSWNTSNGCLLYYTRKALETAGGMRVQFGRWGFEHLEHSYRIHRFGLTPEPFLSLTDQRGICATDEHREDEAGSLSTLTGAERREWYARNRDFYRYWVEQEPRFVPWGS
ncbi:glycosyltransferase [Mycobacterium phage Lukilu]|uniref:Glycosyltransferase n=1 Tax=Mycobacterium phage Lukilu TaxID=1913044 RepID=A0A1J0MA27_9CAUD|nr:glycosyltransferase [Mycobacterium phage Lukilu]APD17236.1 glycosyltransferase [Mycobacterium phage Lukilu]